MIPGSANPLLLTSADSGYAIERSLRFNSGDNANLSRTPSAAGNLKTWTLSFWIKRTSFPTDGTQDGYIFNSSDTGNNNHSMMRFQGQGVQKLQIYLYEFSSSYGAWEIKTSRVYRDASAWYHIVIAMDTTQATAADRLKIYTNGVRETEFDTSNYPAQNANAGQWNSGFPQSIGKPTYGGGTLNAYLADVNFIDGQALAPTDFVELDDNGVYHPKKFAGTYGTNGFHLDFKDNSSNAALGTDTSGNSNTWTVNNLIAAGESISTSAITNVSSADNTGTISATAAGWQSAANAINGNDGSKAPSSNNSAGTITFSQALVGVTKVRAKTRFYGSGEARLYNGSTQVHTTGTGFGASNATQYYTIYDGPAIEIDQYWQQMSASNASDDFWALEINNVQVNTSSNGGNLTVAIPGSAITLTTTDATNYGSLAVGDSVNNGATISAKNSGTPSITVDAGSWSNGDYIVKPSNATADNLRDTPTNGTQADTGAGGE